MGGKVVDVSNSQTINNQCHTPKAKYAAIIQNCEKQENIRNPQNLRFRGLRPVRPMHMDCERY